MLRTAWHTPGCRLLLGSNFAVAIGANLVLPFLAVYLAQEQGLSAAVVAVAVTARFWSQYGFAVVGGWAGDRLGAVTTLRLGLAVRSAAYLTIGFVSQPAAIVGACVLLGLGGALYLPASKAALAGLVGQGSDLKMIFGLRSTVNNAGNALGPPLGVLAVMIDPRTGFLVVSAAFAALAVLLGRLPTPAVASRPQQDAVASDDDAAQERKPYRTLAWISLAAAAFGFCYIPIEFALPLVAENAHGAGIVGILFVLNALCVVGLQLLTSRLAASIPNSAVVIAAGLAAMTAGFAVASLGSIAALIVCVVLMSFGEVLVDPRVDSEIATAMPHQRRGLAFGIVGTATAAGAFAGNLIASQFLAAPDRLWTVLAAVGAVFTIAVFASSYLRERQARASPALDSAGV